MTAQQTDTILSKHLKNIASIWSASDPPADRMVFLERIVLLSLCIAMFATPAFWVRHFGGLAGRIKRKVSVEIYSVIKMALAGVLLFGNFWGLPYISIIAIWLLADLFINLAGYIFLRKFWQNPYSWSRSLILLAVNFLEYSFWFSCLYLAWGLLISREVIVKSSIDAVYFSIVTAATVGFGDITPAPGPGRLVVTIEILLSLFFLATVVSYFVSNLTQVEADKMPLKSVVSEAPTQVASSEH